MSEDQMKLDEAILILKAYCNSSICTECPKYTGSGCELNQSVPAAWKTFEVAEQKLGRVS